MRNVSAAIEHGEARAGRGGDGGNLGDGVPLGEAADDGAEVAHLRNRDPGERSLEQRTDRRKKRRPLGLGLPDGRAEGEAAIALDEVIEAGQPVDVDDEFRPHAARDQERNQALAAGEDFRPAAPRAQQA